MKVIKRDGRIVDYDKTKIKIAIEKANNEVTKKEKATGQDIKTVIEYIEELNKKRILVEDIQDIIEQKLMELGKYELAKKYIVYRYTRALIRKSNTTDASILGLIRNGNREINKNEIEACEQRDLIVGEVSKDLTKRILLPEKIVQAWKEGILYFHDSEFFIQPIINSCYVNMDDMLDNNTVINNTLLECPKSFEEACTNFIQIILTLQKNQYGEQIIDISCLGKYLRKSRENIENDIPKEIKEKIENKTIEELIEKRLKEELSNGIKAINYLINAISKSNEKYGLIKILLKIDEEDEYIKENEIIIKEILDQKIKGMKDENGNCIAQNNPKLIYVLNDCNSLNGGKYDYLTKYAMECSLKTFAPDFMSGKKDIKKGFNQGIVSINLPQIAVLSEGDEEKFWKILDERLELCKDALMYRYYALLGTTPNISPIHWKYGAITRMTSEEKIDKSLNSENSNIYLGYFGIYEMTKEMKGVPHTEPEGKAFAIKVMDYLKKKIMKWRKETNQEFCLYGVMSESIIKELTQIDKEKFGTIEDITDKKFYTSSHHIPNNIDIDVIERLKIENEIQKLSMSESISYIKLSEIKDLESIIKFVYENEQHIEIKNK